MTNNKGKITQVIGPVVDVSFDIDKNRPSANLHSVEGGSSRRRRLVARSGAAHR